MRSTVETLANAYRHYERGQFQHAEDICRIVLAAEPDNVDALYLTGRLAFERRAFEEAARLAKRAVALRPSSAEAQLLLGSALRELADFNSAVLCFETALALQPGLAEAANNLGLALQQLGNTDRALACYRQALKLNPNLAFAHYNLGNLLADTGNLVEASESLQRAIEIRPNYAEAHNNLGTVLHDQDRLDAALVSYKRALKMSPNCAEIYNNIGKVFRERGDSATASRNFDRALELAPDLAEAHLSRATIYLLGGDFERGWSEYVWRLQLKTARAALRQPPWTGEPLEGKTILLHAEQGLGDTIQFVRYASLVKARGATVVLECQPPLVKLLAKCPGVDRLVAAGQPLPEFDFHCPLLSLPAVFQTRLETIPANVPYLFANEGLVHLWRERLAGLSSFRIGINWHGREGHREARRRDVPVELFARLADVPGVRLVCLQKESARAECQMPVARGRESIANEPFHTGTVPPQSTPDPLTRCLPTELGDFDTAHGPFMDTAAVMMNLELVITSDTSVAHLAGAIGVPVWVALPYVPDWRWLLDRSDSPWYPTMRLFRQKHPGDWAAVFAEIQAALAASRRTDPTSSGAPALGSRFRNSLDDDDSGDVHSR
jgi:tetratricopeptide (TPR) repeat protein